MKLWIYIVLILLLPAAYGHAPIAHRVAKIRPTVVREVRYYWGIRESASTFMGQIHQESAFREDAKSKFASGLTQFTPSTAEWIQGLYAAELRELCPDRSGCPLDARWAVRSMVLYDRRLWNGYNFAESDDRWGFTLAAYNGGAGWIKKERELAHLKKLDPNKWFHGVETVCRRASWACLENRHYPRAILFKWRPLYR